MRLDCTKLLKGMMKVKSSKHTMEVSLEWILSLLLLQEVLEIVKEVKAEVQELKRQLSSKLNHPPIAMILLANADREYRDSRFDTNKFIQLSELQYIDLS